jgi:hypothetical protein
MNRNLATDHNGLARLLVQPSLLSLTETRLVAGGGDGGSADAGAGDAGAGRCRQRRCRRGRW